MNLISVYIEVIVPLDSVLTNHIPSFNDNVSGNFVIAPLTRN